MVSLDHKQFKPVLGFHRKSGSALPKFFGSALESIFEKDGKMKQLPADVLPWVQISAYPPSMFGFQEI
jgi:hypothetical protein